MTTHPKSEAARYWMGDVSQDDDFNEPIDDIFYDGKTDIGPWAIMAPRSWRRHCGRTGTGLAQKYEKQADGRWMKVEG